MSGEDDHRFLWADRAYAEEDDDDGADCWIDHDGITSSSDRGTQYRIGNQSIWLPKSHIVASTEKSVQVTRWLKTQRPGLFTKTKHRKDE